jgi:hypothetical protein
MAQETKDPFTRLLDMTLGWGEYVEKTEEDFSDSVKAEEIYEVYQSVAEFAEPYWDASQEAQEQALRTFIDTRLLPLLLGSRMQEVSHSASVSEERSAMQKVAA